MKVVNKKGVIPKERRDFLKKMGSVAVMGMLGASFFTSCTEEEDDIPAPTNGGNQASGGGGSTDDGINIDGSTITIDLTIVTELAVEGGWLLIGDAQTLVINDGGIKALTSICTHSGCDRNWTLNNGNFRCTCHGSVFTSNGTVVSGPANAPLRQFDVSTADDIVTITK